ncbi:MAG: MFS transporter, partial [Candidatus Hydrogenedentes bacterium]|nr:MFS transporter [Candidatus Hydrogenedentota bacterium]
MAYTFATLFALFGIVYRYTMWLQRPPTWLYFKRGWQAFLKPDALARNLAIWVRRLVSGFALNAFIWRRDVVRGGAHWLIMWGCIIAVAITFPLVFGWIHFETPPNDFEHYTIFVFGLPTITIAAEGWLAMFIFHGLVWSSLLVIPGVMLAMRRRMRGHDAAATQRFGED